MNNSDPKSDRKAKTEPKGNFSSSGFKVPGIFWGLLIGVLMGVGLNLFIKEETRNFVIQNFLDPAGQIFLRGLFMVVVPLVFASLVVGVARLGDLQNVKRLGLRLGCFYGITTLVAILIGQILVTSFKPGNGFDGQLAQSLKAGFQNQVSGLMEKSQSVPESLWPGIITATIPKNIVSAFGSGDMLAVIFVGLIFGFALILVNKEKSGIVLNFFEAVSESCVHIVGWVMKFAPIAVGALIAISVSKFGLNLLGGVAAYFGVVVLGYFVQIVFIYGTILKLGVGISPLEFFKKASPVLLTAFSTSSSNATLPTTMNVAETRFGIPKEISRFSLPLGATVNMDGTALFEMVAALFIAQVFGIELSVADHVSLIALILISSVGVAGVPGGSIPLLMSAMAMVGIPAEGIALVLGVDRLLDMGRTVVNVTGDMVAALYVSKPLGVEQKAAATTINL